MRWLVLLIALSGCAHSKWQVLEHDGLLSLASLYAVPVAQDAKDPHRAEALSALVRLQELRHDDLQLPETLDRLARGGARFIEPDASRVAYLRARIALREGNFAEAVSLCEQVIPSSQLFERAQYLRAIALADFRLERSAESIAIFERLANQAVDPKVKIQATLSLGRIAYREQRWSDSVRWYSEVAKHEPLRARVLVEQAWALGQLGDWDAARANVTSDEVKRSGISEAQLVEALALRGSGRGDEAEMIILREAPDVPISPDDRLMSVEANIASGEAELKKVKSAELARQLNQNLKTLRRAAGDLASKNLEAQQEEKAATAGRLALLSVELALERKDLETAIKRQEALVAQPPVDGPLLSELRLRLAALQRAKAAVSRGVPEEKAITEAMTSFERFLESNPVDVRLREAREVLSPD